MAGLNEELEHRWEEYLAAEGRLPRRDVLARLRAFIADASLLDDASRRAWVHDLLGHDRDAPRHVPIRAPLFEEIIFPILRDDYRAGDGKAAGWLADLAQSLYGCRKCWEELGYATELELRREGLRRNPGDEMARRRLVEAIANYIRHTIHELPSGVLFGMNGASAEECIELAGELEGFTTLLHGEEIETYRELVETARHHYAAYGRYLAERTMHESYAAFLRGAANGSVDSII